MKKYFKKILYSISRKRSFSQSKSLDTKLSRCLSTYQLLFYGLSHMIGAGIYVILGHIIRDRVGSATNLSFLFSGLISIFTGLCYCEFSTLIPKAGSCYTYTYLMLGELPAFLIGWTMIIDSIIALASVSKGFSGALDILCNNAIKNFTDKFLPLHNNNSEIWESSIDIVAFALLFSLFFITLTGANISMNINSVLALLQVIVLGIIIIGCFIYGSHQNFIADGGYLPFGFPSIFQGAGIAIFAYSGFESLANSAEETKDPKKSIPIALLVSLSMVIVLYVLTSSGLSYMVPRLQINQKAPFIYAFAINNLTAMKWISGIGTLLATGTSKLAMLYLLPRIIYAMADDGLLFRFLGKVDKRTKIPVFALLVGLILTGILAMFVKIQILADLTSMGIILSFITTGIDLLLLRYVFIEKNDENLDEKSQLMKMKISTHPIFYNRDFFTLILTLLIFSIILTSLSVVFIFQLSQIAGIICTSITITMTITFFIILTLYEPNSIKDSFKTPLMPLTPIITITSNIFLLINLPGGTWIRFIILTFIGLIIYIFYGIPNSNLSEKQEEKAELISINKSDDEKSNKD